MHAAGPLGGVVFRGVAPGRGYFVAAGGAHATGWVAASLRLTVLPDRSAPPSTRIYGQRIVRSGYGYLTARDGIKLAIDVRLPAGPGPYPTLVEYSGYGYADPAGAESGISPIANLLGFAVVDVNMRGTGCSGGAFSFFEPLQSLDGYDVIETVARQPWVLGHRVGMIGISYGGISQLFVAATDPPHLAAIAPLSVFDNIATTLYPGGILNTGFGLPFARARDVDAEAAAPGRGEAWALNRIRGGDRVCAANQALHPEAVNEVNEVYANRYYVPSVADPLNPTTFVRRIRVPVYLACQWTDEQTGGHCPDLAEHFTGTREKWFTFTNGVHVDSLDPLTAMRWYDFLSLFVAHRLPALSPAVRALAPELYQVAMGVSGVSFPADDPIEDEGSYAAALAAFERLPSVRILFDNGAASGVPSRCPGRCLRAVVCPLADPGNAAGVLVSGLGRSPAAGHHPPRRRRRSSRGTRPPGRPPTSAGTPGLAVCGASPRVTTGASLRAAARCPTSARRWPPTQPWWGPARCRCGSRPRPPT